MAVTAVTPATWPGPLPSRKANRRTLFFLKGSCRGSRGGGSRLTRDSMSRLFSACASFSSFSISSILPTSRPLALGEGESGRIKGPAGSGQRQGRPPGRVPGHVVRRAGRGAARGDAGLHAVRALQAQCVVGVLAILPALPADRQVVQDGVVHERGEAGGARREGGRPVQGIPLALRLGRSLLLQLSQAPPLLLDHLLSCGRDRAVTAGPLGDTGSITEARGEQGEVSTGPTPQPPTSSPKATPRQPQVQPPCQRCGRLQAWPPPRRLASALPQHPAPHGALTLPGGASGSQP